MMTMSSFAHGLLSRLALIGLIPLLKVASYAQLAADALNQSDSEPADAEVAL